MTDLMIAVYLLLGVGWAEYSAQSRGAGKLPMGILFTVTLWPALLLATATREFLGFDRCN